MKKIIVILTFAITTLTILLSCSTVIERKNIPRYWFMDSILNDPDNILTIIDRSLYYNERMRKVFIVDDTLKSYIQYIKELTKEGYDYIYFNQIPLSGESKISNKITLTQEIKVKGVNSDLYINFYFEIENNKWVLCGIDKHKKSKLEISEQSGFIHLNHQDTP